MKSKFYLKIFTVFALLILSVLLFSACQASNSDTALNNGEEECAHEWQTTSAVAPTCGEDGYLEYRCNLCKRKKAETVEALECVYETSWTWHNKNTLAVLHFECTSDASHNFSIEDKIPKSKIEPSTCISDGFEEITATVEYNGVSYTDTITLDAVGNGAHQYTIVSQTLLGESCTDGVKTVGVCKLCNNDKETVSYNHMPQNYNIEVSSFDDLGLCSGGYVYCKGCLCGEERDEQCYVNYDGCSMVESQEGEIVTTKGKVVNEKKTFICENCTFTYTAEREFLQENEIQHVGYTFNKYRLNEELSVEVFECDKLFHPLLNHEATIVYTLDDETKASKHRVSFACKECLYQYETEASHDYEKAYELLGKSCTDGIEITKKCRDCGYTDNEVVKRHITKTKERYEYLLDHGCCMQSTITISECYCGNRYLGGYDWMALQFDCVITEKTEVLVKTEYTKTVRYTYECRRCGYLYEEIAEYVRDGDEAILVKITRNLYLSKDLVFLDIIPQNTIIPGRVDKWWR